MLNKIIEGMATAMTIGGYALISWAYPSGFIISAFANLLWLAYGHEINSKGIMVTNAALLIASVNGIIQAYWN